MQAVRLDRISLGTIRCAADGNARVGCKRSSAPLKIARHTWLGGRSCYRACSCWNDRWLRSRRDNPSVISERLGG